MMRYSHFYMSGLLLLVALGLRAPALAATAPVSGAASPPAQVAPVAPVVEARKEAWFNPALSYGDRIIAEDTVWRGEVLVEGAVTVAPHATLTVEPGTVVRFRRKESAQAPLLVVQGRIAATGTRETPILFTSSFAVPAAGDWQGVMLLGSEKKNVLENCLIEAAQTGLEALYSSVTLKNVRAERAGTGMRFQDALVVMESGGATDCDTGLSFSETEATLRNLNLSANRLGLSAKRSSIYLQDAAFSVNRVGLSGEGCRVKIQGGAFLDNGSGVTLFECEGTVTGARLDRNREYGMSLTASRIRVTANQITGNTGSGLLVFDGASVAWDNAIHDNAGYDLYNAGKEEFRAPGNWWGASGPKIFDNRGFGKVLHAPLLPKPPAPLQAQ